MPLAKPESCTACPLVTIGTGWVPRSGSPNARLAIIGEAAGAREAANGIPLHPTGESGGMFNRWLEYAGARRDDLLIHNVLSCRPPSNELKGAGYAEDAIRHCRPNLDETLAHPYVRAILALGGTATRELLQIPESGFELKDWHGTVNRLPGSPDENPIYVIPTFHPAHLTRGAWSLTEICVNDLYKARWVAEHGWAGQPADIIVDPPVEWFDAWVDLVLQFHAQDPTIWMGTDCETADKARDEGTLKAGEGSGEIIRSNFAVNQDQGVTVPHQGGYMRGIRRLLASAITKIFWYKKFDLTRYKLNEIVVNGTCLDFMWAWHALQSDLPRGLGFVSPLYSGFGAWKHLSDSNPGYYAGVDPVQTLRNAVGITVQLKDQGRWDAFYRHMHLVDEYLFWPATDVGLLIDRQKLEGTKDESGEFKGGYKQLVDESVKELWNKIQELAPGEVRKLDPPEGLKTEPKGTERKNPDFEKNPGSPEFLPLVMIPGEFEVKTCLTCGSNQRITIKHVCKGEGGKPDRSKVPEIVHQKQVVNRWYVTRQFNPNSSEQMLAALEAWKHKPGKNKNGNPSADKLTLERLKKSAKPESTREFYKSVLEYRQVKKLKSAYVDSVIRQLDEGTDGRLHGETTHKPSTLRTAMMRPNLQNLPTRSKLSEGFRETVVAMEEPEVPRG